MASPTQWTWVWVNFGSLWWTGRPGVLQSMGFQRVGHDWATELNWLYTWNFLRVDLKHSHHIHTHIMWGKRYIHYLYLGNHFTVSNHNIKSLCCTLQIDTIIFVNYSFNKVGRKKKENGDNRLKNMWLLNIRVSFFSLLSLIIYLFYKTSSFWWCTLKTFSKSESRWQW